MPSVDPSKALGKTWRDRGGGIMTRGRSQALAILAVTIAWQIYVVLSVASRAATFRKLFAGLGAELPLMTRIFFESVRWWFVVPVFFAVLLIDCARRQRFPAWYLPALIGSSLAAGFLLQAWATEACSGPMFSLIKQIG
jgi:hypothetical protein